MRNLTVKQCNNQIGRDIKKLRETVKQKPARMPLETILPKTDETQEKSHWSTRIIHPKVTPPHSSINYFSYHACRVVFFSIIEKANAYKIASVPFYESPKHLQNCAFMNSKTFYFDCI